MPRFNVRPEKEAELLQRLAELGVEERDLVERFIRGSGPGGQKRNKTSSCVHLVHTPSGIEVKCQRERSQSVNRYLARRELCEAIEARLLGQPTARKKEAIRVKKQKKRRAAKRQQRQK